MEISHGLNSALLKVTATDANGNSIPVRFKTVDNNKISVTSKTAGSVNVSISTRDPNERTAGEQAMDFAAFFGTMIRRVQATYRHTNSLTVQASARR